MAQKLRRVILLRLGLVNFKFHFPQKQKSHHFNDLGTCWKCHRAPETIILAFGDTKLLQKVDNNSNITFETTYYFWKSHNLANRHFHKKEKTHAENPEDPCHIFENIEYGIDIFKTT